MAIVWIYICMVFLTICNLVYTQDVTYHVDEELQDWMIGNVAADTDLFTSIGEADSSTLTYSFLNTNNRYSHYFRIDYQTSELFTQTDGIDREAVCPFEETCMLKLEIAAKSTLGSFFRILKIHVFIQDINDHAPAFTKSLLTLPISEGVLVGTSFAIEGAQDRDTSTEYSLKVYELESNDLMLSEDLPFSIQFVKHLDGSSIVRLYVTASLDREITDSYNLEIVAKDGDNPPLIGRLPVIIRVLDINDNPPKFSSQNFDVQIKENTILGSAIIQLKATDADYEENGLVKYRLSPHQSAEVFRNFQINPLEGEIMLKERLLYSPGKSINIIVEAYDNPLDGQSLTTQALVKVTVEDTGNHVPIINVNMLTSAVSEYANIGTVVAFVSVVDHDQGKEGVASCIMANTGVDFSLQTMDMINQYKVIVAKKLDFEITQQQAVTVHCQDNGTPPLRANATFTMEIKDENDHTPAFKDTFLSRNVGEDAGIGQFILTVSANDLDGGRNGEIYFTVPEDYNTQFYFDNSTTTRNSAHLRLNKSLNRETKAAYVFPIYAIDKGTPANTGTATVSLQITDINDVVPEFTKKPFEFEILENLPADAEVGRVTARDTDLGTNSQIEFKMHPDYLKKVPFVVFADGLIKTDQELDREYISHYEFKVIVTDMGENPLSSTGTVIVKVSDANDMDPKIEFPNSGNNSVTISPIIVAWQIVTRVSASDADEMGTGNSKLRYSIQGRNDSKLFQLNPNTGEIQVTRKLDLKYVNKVYRLEIFVADYGTPTQRTDIKPLYVIISSHNATAEPTDVLSNQNFLIAIVVGVVTVVVSVAIVATILILRKIDRQRKEKRKKENNSEDPEDLDNKRVFDGSITVFSLPSEDSLLEKEKKQVSFSLEDDVFSDDDLIQKNGLDHHNHRHFKPVLSYLAPGPKKMEDNHSETSGDTGTSDSGRGGSDEEMHPRDLSHSPRDKMMDLSRQIPPMQHQEIIPFSFKKGLSMPIHSDFDRPSLSQSDLERKNHRNDLEKSRSREHEKSRSHDQHRPMNGMSTMAVHYHNDTLDRSRNKVVLLQTDSGIHSDTNSNEGDVSRDYMV